MLRVVGSVITARTFCGVPVGTEMTLSLEFSLQELIYSYAISSFPRFKLLSILATTKTFHNLPSCGVFICMMALGGPSPTVSACTVQLYMVYGLRPEMMMDR